MKIRKHMSILMGLALACGLVSCFNDTAFDNITTPHILDTLPFDIRPSGAALWARTVKSGSDESSFNSVAAGSDGFIYAAGYIVNTGTYNFNNGITATGQVSLHNAVLVKYDSNGKAQWAKTPCVATAASSFNAVAIGNDGSVYAAGRINNKSQFNFGTAAKPITVSGTYSGTNENIVLVKYDSNGNTQWATSLYPGTDTYPSQFNSVAVGSDGVYAAGYIIQNTSTPKVFDFGSATNHQTVTGSYSGSNVVVVKYDFNGNALWATTVAISGTPNASAFNSIAVESDNIYAVGYITNNTSLPPAEFDFGTLPAQKVTGPFNGSNVVVVKYSTVDGSAIWAKTVTTGPNASAFNSVAVGSDGSVYAVGYIYGLSEYDFAANAGFRKVSGGYNERNILLVKYDPADGSAGIVRSVSTGSAESEFMSVSVGSDGVYVAGYIKGNSSFDFGNNVTATGLFASTRSIIAMKYGFSGGAKWASTVSDGHISQFNSVYAGSDGIYTAGSIQENSQDVWFNFGYFVTATGPCAPGDNIILVKYKP